MSNKNLFKSAVKSIKAPNTINNSGATAYSLSDKAALAQLALTGCFNNTYYVSDKDQLDNIIRLGSQLPVEFVAKLAVYARQHGLMKDTPAVLAAIVAARDVQLLKRIFPKVIDDPKMLRNFVQVIRSGVTGRKSLGTALKKLIEGYFNSLTDEQVFKANVGNDPSLKDILKLAHPRPLTNSRSALYKYLLGNEIQDDLILLVSQFENFKNGNSLEVPDVPFQMLTALPLNDRDWKKIASKMTFNQIRMNLNTLLRHNVLSDNALVDKLAAKLSDKNEVARSGIFPYQLFTAFLNIDSNIPKKLSVALQLAAEHSLTNIPDVKEQSYILVDTSGSMTSPVTGHRGSATTKMRCIDAAALIASSFMRKNPAMVEVIPFDTRVHAASLNAMDSMMTNAKKLAGYGGGGTDCAAPLRYLNDRNAKGNLVIMISDNESNPGILGRGHYNRGTNMAEEWNKYKARNLKAKLVCLDLTPNSTTQIESQKDVLNLGGFSDNVFSVISMFMENGNDHSLWTNVIDSVEI